jgi:hypothetical protein
VDTSSKPFVTVPFHFISPGVYFEVATHAGGAGKAVFVDVRSRSLPNFIERAGPGASDRRDHKRVVSQDGQDTLVFLL